MTKIDLTKKLKVGDKVYSALSGKIENVSNITTNMIYLSYNSMYYIDGSFFKNGECLLFPSKDNRDWNTYQNNSFTSYQKILVRDDIDEIWNIDLYAYLDNSCTDYPHVTLTGAFKHCLPFEGNEHLLGTCNRS